MKVKVSFLVVLLTVICISSLSFALSSSSKFVDVKNHWAAADIAFVEANGLMIGYPGKMFNPGGKVSRLETAVVLDRVFDFNFDAIRFIKEPSLKDRFDDVVDGKWYSTSLLEATFFGVLNTNDRTFGPSKPVTRIELAKAIKQSFEAKNLNIISTQIFPTFKDTENLNSEESASLNFVYNTGIMKGLGENFNPSKPVTRAELASILKRIVTTLKTVEPTALQ